MIRKSMTLLALALALAAFANEQEEVRAPDKEIVRKKTKMDFNDSLIDGELTRPEEGYIPGSGKIRFESLIELRKDFLEELQTSTKNL